MMIDCKMFGAKITKKHWSIGRNCIANFFHIETKIFIATMILGLLEQSQPPVIKNILQVFVNIGI